MPTSEEIRKNIMEIAGRFYDAVGIPRMLPATAERMNTATSLYLLLQGYFGQLSPPEISHIKSRYITYQNRHQQWLSETGTIITRDDEAEITRQEYLADFDRILGMPMNRSNYSNLSVLMELFKDPGFLSPEQLSAVMALYNNYEKQYQDMLDEEKRLEEEKAKEEARLRRLAEIKMLFDLMYPLMSEPPTEIKVNRVRSYFQKLRELRFDLEDREEFLKLQDAYWVYIKRYNDLLEIATELEDKTMAETKAEAKETGKTYEQIIEEAATGVPAVTDGRVAAAVIAEPLTPEETAAKKKAWVAALLFGGLLWYLSSQEGGLFT